MEKTREIESRLAKESKDKPPVWLQLNQVAFILFLSSQIRKMFNKYRVPIDPELRGNWFSIYCDDSKEKKYTKVTIASYSRERCASAANLFKSRTDRHVTFHKVLNLKHCSICYDDSHTHLECTRCLKCNGHHQTKDCGKNVPSSTKCVIKSTGAKGRLQRQRQYLKTALGGNLGWKKGCDYDLSLVNGLQPFGYNEDRQKTIAIATEGLTPLGIAIKVSVAGYYPNRMGGVKSMWSSLIKTNDYRNLDTKIHANDIELEGMNLENVKQVLLKYCSQKRLCIYDQYTNDLKKLKIQPEDINLHKINVINVQQLYGGVSLRKVVEFMLPESAYKLLKDGIIIGSNSDMDARFIIRLYRKFYTTLTDYGEFPIGNDLRTQHFYKKNINDWIQEQTEAVLNGGRNM